MKQKREWEGGKVGERDKGKEMEREIKKKNVKKKLFFGSNFERRFRIMGKLKKKGEHGHKAAYLTRRQAILKLQVSFKMFRKLCILKGIAPRVPKIARASKRQTYYLAKDITYLSHEPLIETFRKYGFPPLPFFLLFHLLYHRVYRTILIVSIATRNYFIILLKFFFIFFPLKFFSRCLCSLLLNCYITLDIVRISSSSAVQLTVMKSLQRRLSRSTVQTTILTISFVNVTRHSSTRFTTSTIRSV